MKVHELKTIPPYFDAVYSGQKTFEFRKDDRGFQVGDWLFLKEYIPTENDYTGRECMVKVTYILRDFAGIESGYVIMAVHK